MVLHNGKLSVFGGLGKPFQMDGNQSEDGPQYIDNRSFDFEFGYGWNNELHVFDPQTKQWRQLQCSGSRPPPVAQFTFNKIDQNKALLYGGRLQRTTFSSVHIINLETLHWTGPFEPQSPAQPWPPARCLHTSCCLVDPSSEMASHHQKLITIWGKGEDNKHVNNVWILDVASMTWKELNLNLRARMFHMSCSYHYGEMQTDVIVFGGNKRRQSKFERHVMTDLRILRFGTVQDLQGMCISLIKRKWDTFKLLLSQLPQKLQQMIHSHLEEQHEVIYPTASDFV